MRASDEDRQRAVEELRRHCAAGRIDVDEYASRVERALSAATLEELDEIRADLPMLRIADPVGGRSAGGREGGRSTAIELLTGGHRHGAGPAQRVMAVAVAVITVMVVLAAIVISLVAEWTWAVVLLAGWAVGLAQGRLGRRGPPAS